MFYFFYQKINKNIYKYSKYKISKYKIKFMYLPVYKRLKYTVTTCFLPWRYTNKYSINKKLYYFLNIFFNSFSQLTTFKVIKFIKNYIFKKYKQTLFLLTVN